MESLKWIWYASYVLVLLGLSGYGCHRLGIIYLYLKHSWRRPRVKERFAELPLVTVQLPVFNEMHVVERLLAAVSKLDYPQDKLQIQLLQLQLPQLQLQLQRLTKYLSSSSSSSSSPYPSSSSSSSGLRNT